MNADELDALLDSLEAALAADIDAQLSLVAADFTDGVDGATVLTAAAFKVSTIREFWARRVPRIMDRLKRITRKASDTAATDLDADPLGKRQLDQLLKPYVKATEALLNAVGDRLAAEATQALADGLAAGEDVSQLKARLTDLFNARGGQLGATRAQRIAATEATRAWNAATLATAQQLTGPDRPLVKQWQTRRDERVRLAHHDADGQVQFLDDPFRVGDTDMQYPGDPTAPAALTVNCRCIMRVQGAPDRQEGADTVTADGTAGDQDFQSAMPAKLKAYWISGEGAAKIRWGTPGDFDRCVKELRGKFPQDPKGLCANLHHEALGKWPGQEGLAVNPDGTVHTGAMVALLPSEADMARLAQEGGEPANQLHLTQFYLGDAADWDDDARNQVVASMAYAARVLTPVAGRVFGASVWNPASDEPAYVWNVGDDLDVDGSRLADARYEVQYALEDRHGGPDLPQQHSPWQPHICAAYGKADLDALAALTGPVTFDRLVVAFGGEWTVLPLTGDAAADVQPEPVDDDVAQPVDEAFPPVATWSTPGNAALAFENQQTGDGRVFASGALYWDGPGPWPLQYAEAMLGGHDGARLAGAIQSMGRDGGRIPGSGVLYLTQPAGVEAGMLLAQGAPLGVSVDLDDVDMELTTRDTGQGGVAPDVAVDAGPYRAHLVTASLLPLPDGGFHLVGDTDATATASGATTVAEASRMSFRVGPDGSVPASAFDIVAAAGDADSTDGVVVDQQRSGDLLMRITRARVRGATLVSIPAYADARIVLDNAPDWLSASLTAAADDASYDTVVRHVRQSPSPVAVADAAHKLKLSIVTVKRHLAAAARKGQLVKIARGTYVRSGNTDTPARQPYTPLVAAADWSAGDSLTASASGVVDLPVAPRDTPWDGDAAKRRVLDWAGSDCEKAGRAFAYRDDAVDDCTQANAWKLGYADVLDGTLTIIPDGAAAALAAVNGARGGADLGGDTDAVRNKLEAVRAHVAESLGTGGEGNNMEASAWTAMRDMPPMPADWFSDPTDLLPPGGPGVNYSNGRIYGWVAQAGEPHAGFAKKITIDGLGHIDTQHFLRQRFTLDDGSVVKAGAFTMNAGHHRDGAECETSACQFDDTRTVAGIVTVGVNDRGMWFSGAAAPWMSDWDRQVFMATQPSYHMKKGPSGNWQLRAVLAVPVPGHSSPLLASAVVARSQEALTAAVMMAEVDDAIQAEQDRQAAGQDAVQDDAVAALDYDRLADALVAAMVRADQLKQAEAAELAALQAEADAIS